jgi:hypothetical protein
MFPLVSHLAVISGLFTSIDAHYVDLSVDSVVSYCARMLNWL